MWAVRIAAWNSDELPIYEPGLDAIIREVRGRNLFFSTDVEGALVRAASLSRCVAARAADAPSPITCPPRARRSARPTSFSCR